MVTVEPTYAILMINFIAILMCSRSVLCKDIYIKALSNDHCLGSPHFTLTQFSLNASYLTDDANDISLIFDEGNHSLESELRIAQKISFFMVGNTTSLSNGSVVVTCNEHRRFKFNGVYTMFT